MRALAVIIAVPCGFIAGFASGLVYGVLIPNSVVPAGMLPLLMPFMGALIAGVGAAALVRPRR